MYQNLSRFCKFKRVLHLDAKSSVACLRFSGNCGDCGNVDLVLVPERQADIFAEDAMARISIADDDVILVEILRFRLEAAADEAVAALDGMAAQEAAGAQHPDRIVLDSMMPMISGSEVLARLKADLDLKDSQPSWAAQPQGASVLQKV